MQIQLDEPDPAPEHLLRETDRLQTLNEISRVVSATLSLGTLYETIYQQIGRVMDTSQFFLALHRPERNEIEIPYLREEGRLSINLHVTYGDSVTSSVIHRGTPFLFGSTNEFDRYARANGLPESIIVGDDDSSSGIFVPLSTGSRTIGAITVQSRCPYAYSQDDVQTLMVIASQAAVAIENARLYEESQASVRQMEVLLRVAQAISSSLHLGTVLDSILAGMREVVPYRLAAILLPDHDRRCLDVAGTVGPLEEEDWRQITIPFGEGITGRVYETGDALLVPDVRQYPGYIDHGISEIRSELALPLTQGNTIVGVLDVERSAVGAFTPDEVSVLSLFASQAAIAIENARLFAAQRQRVTELQTIQSIVQQLTPLHDVGTMAEVINRELKQLIEYHACRIFVVAGGGEELISLSGADFDPAGMHLAVGQGITGAIARSGRSEIIGNTLADPRSSQIVGTPRRAESMLGAPLIYEGRVRGVITLSKLGVDQFDENGLRLLEIIAAQAALAFDRARLYDELRTDAVTDDLTKLYNRRYLIRRFGEERARALRNKHSLVAMMVDIDKFKRVNDTYGHDAGDVVLQDLATVIRAVVRAEDIVCRYGGEEFCILLPEIPLHEAQRVAERLRTMIDRRKAPEAARSCHISVSIGLAQMLQEDDDAEIFTRADNAMYAVKRWGGNAVRVWQREDAAHA